MQPIAAGNAAAYSQAAVIRKKSHGYGRRKASISAYIANRQEFSIVGEISEASAEQSRDMQQNAALVEESAAAAESLRTQARQLVQAVAELKQGTERSRLTASGG